jgi:hypothetical protein
MNLLVHENLIKWFQNLKEKYIQTLEYTIFGAFEEI